MATARSQRFASLSILTLVLLGGAHASAAPVIGAPTQDADGVLHYPVTSVYEGGAPNELRVVLPKSAGSGQRRFLYALPVEPGTQSSFGDPVATIRALGVVDAFHLILVVPAFSITPWYADHPSDSSIRQESYLVTDLVPALDTLFPETRENPGPPRRLLLGFSKSGLGAASLILRHSGLFDAAAMWDAPLNQVVLSSLPGMAAVFGTQANYETYAIPKALPLHAAELGGAARLWLGGYSSQAAWRNDMTAAHDAMTSLGMAHVWVDGPQRAHRWDSGWVEEAVTFLHTAAPAVVFGADGGSDASLVEDAGGDATNDGMAGASAVDATAAHDAGGGAEARGARDDGACGCSTVGDRHDALTEWLSALGLVVAWRRRRTSARAKRASSGRDPAPSTRSPEHDEREAPSAQRRT